MAKYVITGPPGGGKTAILRELGAMGFTVAAEPAREVLAEQRAIDGDGTYDRDRAQFFRLMFERAIDDFERTASSPVFFDRGLPDLVAYAALFELDPSAAERAARERRYDEPVFVAPAWAEIYTTDDERKATFEQAQVFGDMIVAAYERLGYAMVELPRAEPSERASFIVGTLQLPTGG